MAELLDEPTAPKPSRRLERWLMGIIIAIVVVLGGSYALAYAMSPAAIRHPSHTHYHYRIVMMVNGREINFGANVFQTDYAKDVCSAALTKEPVHFHDNISQYGHVHWAGITGGLILKDYGWNFVGGLPATLGYRFDQGLIPQRVTIHANALPDAGEGDNYYIYTGTATTHTERKWNDFLTTPLDQFLKGTPVIDAAEAADLKAKDMTSADMNDVVGNVVIFVEDQPPTAAQVTGAFTELTPLPDSPCEG